MPYTKYGILDTKYQTYVKTFQHSYKEKGGLQAN